MNALASARASAFLAASELGSALLILKDLGYLSVLILVLMFQDIHPNIIYELLPNFRMSHREVRAIILAMMQIRRFSSSFLLMEKIQQNLHQVIARGFKRKVFLRLLKNSGFKIAVLKQTGQKIGEFISNFVLLQKMSRSIQFQLPYQRLFLSSCSDLYCLRNAYMLNYLIHSARSSYPEVVSFLEQNPSELQNIIDALQKQLQIINFNYVGKNNYEKPSQNQEKHLMRDLFVFFFLIVIKPDMIENFGNETVPFRDTCNSEDLDFLKRNCKTEDMKRILLKNGCNIPMVIQLLSSSFYRDSHAVKYTIKPESSSRPWFSSQFYFQVKPASVAPAPPKFYQIDDPQFERLEIKTSAHSHSYISIFKSLLECFLKNSARNFTQLGGGESASFLHPTMPISQY